MRADDRDEAGYAKPDDRLRFLGSEFLTWCYFYLGGSGQAIDLQAISPVFKASGEARVVVGKQATLRPRVNKEKRVSVTSPVLDDSGELMQAIMAGALIDSLKDAHQGYLL